jgi:hypothetical protein
VQCLLVQRISEGEIEDVKLVLCSWVERRARCFGRFGDEVRVKPCRPLEPGEGDRIERVPAGVIHRPRVNRLNPRDAEWFVSAKIAGHIGSERVADVESVAIALWPLRPV